MAIAARRKLLKVHRKAVVGELKGISMKLVPSMVVILFGAKLAGVT